MRYADPTLCPDCRSPLPAAATSCPSCSLVVRHPVAVQLFGTLQTADALLAQLRSVTAPAPTHPQPAPAPLPAPSPAPPPRTGVRFASVPKILLGLGALCLLVAAIVFLAVSWSALGVGGRTAVLAGFTLAAGSAALLLHRAGLRIAGESLSVVALGLLALDVLGAGAAGWLGDGAGSGVALTAGLALVVAGTGLGLLRVGAERRLVAPQVISGIGLATAYLAALDTTDHRLLTGHALTAVGIGVVLLARRQGMPALLWSQLSAAALAWLGTGGIAFVEALTQPDLHQLWVEGSGWALLATAAAMLLPGLVAGDRRGLLAGASCAAAVLTVVATLPCLDSGTGTVGLVALVVTTGWVLALALLPHAVRTLAVMPSLLGGAVLTVLSIATVGVATERWTALGIALDRPADVVLRRPDPVTEPLLLVPSLLVLVALAALLQRARGTADRRTWIAVALLATGLGAAATLASYDVLLVLPLGVVVLLAVAGMLFSLRSTGRLAAAAGTAAVVVAGAACVLALPSWTLTMAVAAVAFLVALALAIQTNDRTVRTVAGLAAAPYLALAIAAGVDLADARAAWVAIPVLVAVGVLALCLPREEVEIGAVAAALATFPASLGSTTDEGGFTALWLTIAGCLFCATALLHESRRSMAGVGSGLLLLATWVRLADLGVREPEPYTLPLAAALLGLGLWRMQRDNRVGTAEALLPGLLLGLVPSLVWVLAAPVSLRALLLGTACLALTIAGASLRWSAPLLAGATVGAAVVVREIGAYPGEIPKWVWIALAGMLLIVVGITWERRLAEVRSAVGYLGRLR